MKTTWFCLAGLSLALGLTSCSTDRAEPAAASDRQAAASGLLLQPKGNTQMQKATFGAGCFWGVEAAFRKLKGVTSTAVGYSGGSLDNPTYQDVCTDGTGHAEVVQVEYDPAQVSYEQLLEVFWSCHDPTTLNRQGPDFGSQYRSVVFYHSPQQQEAAVASKEALEKEGKYERPIVTEIVPAAAFWRAEDYHQQYLEKRGMSSCRTH